MRCRCFLCPEWLLDEQGLQESAYDVDKPDHDSAKDGKNGHSVLPAVKWSVTPDRWLGRATPVTA
ncbi:hypothetical protein GCM10010289_11910 [Streptomyces violascens]|uniref:Uncharacterized protein n=1 Tax=Streptomyces violascens TaxID=67381 RepID=A0ABQ3QKF3_9ACTN|nr:hypothetical protein GCM10010289_11910 [Streptomyces violascens]GHI37759.1 hypothetical protein Sviol_21670 [Streptomyces violascens]